MTHYMQMISQHLFHLLQLEFLKELSRPLGNPNEESQFFKVNTNGILLPKLSSPTVRKMFEIRG